MHQDLSSPSYNRQRVARLEAHDALTKARYPGGLLVDGYPAHALGRDALVGRVYITDTSSSWANPFPARRHGIAESVRLYEAHILGSPSLILRLSELENKVVVCERNHSSKGKCAAEVLCYLVRDARSARVDPAHLSRRIWSSLPRDVVFSCIFAACDVCCYYTLCLVSSRARNLVLSSARIDEWLASSLEVYAKKQRACQLSSAYIATRVRLGLPERPRPSRRVVAYAPSFLVRMVFPSASEVRDVAAKFVHELVRSYGSWLGVFSHVRGGSESAILTRLIRLFGVRAVLLRALSFRCPSGWVTHADAALSAQFTAPGVVELLEAEGHAQRAADGSYTLFIWRGEARVQLWPGHLQLSPEEVKELAAR
jgi:hypothetical protein